MDIEPSLTNTSKQEDFTDCKPCGGKCSIIIYKAFARSYISKQEPNQNEPIAIDLTNDIAFMEQQTDDHDITNEMILTAKRMYLRNHYKDDTCSLKCEYDPCDALNIATSCHYSLNALSELERAHLTFYHRNAFDKHRRHRHRSKRYGYKTLSNDALNQESKEDDSDISDSNELKEDDSIDEAVPSAPTLTAKGHQLKQLSLDMFSMFVSEKPEKPTPQIGATRLPIKTDSKPKYTQSKQYQSHTLSKKNKPSDKDVIAFGYAFTTKHAQAKFKNLKHEVLHIEFKNLKLKVTEWNTLLKSCTRYVKVSNARRIKLNLKEVVGLKLYTDYDLLQSQFRSCFRIIDEERRIQMQKNFVHWNGLLVSACKKANDDIRETLYHGMARLNKASTFRGKYYGPVSTTTALQVAKTFSGDKGSIVVLHPVYSMAGMRLEWISNYPTEDEVLYMNVTFQITDILDPKTEKSKLLPIEEKSLAEIKNALQHISVNSNVLSLNSGNTPQNVIVINELSVLKTLYLQYKPQRWDEICQMNADYAETLTVLRDQFVHLIEKVKAVEMHQTSPLIQQFFSVNQAKYKPFNWNMKEEMDAFHDTFSHNVYYFKMQTIIRLFPGAEEISINANNWDFTLNEFVEFLNKWRYDYTAIPLKYISIKFIDKSNKTSDERAIEELERCHASRNISKLLKLGWKFLTPSTLSRVPFQPAPELPFLLTFVENRNSKERVFYRQYTAALLKRDSSHKSVEGYGSDHSDAMDSEAKDCETEIHHNPKICILSNDVWNKTEYKQNVKKMLNKVKLGLVSPREPGDGDTNQKSKLKESFIKACDTVNSLILDPLPKDLIPIFKQKKVISYEVITDIFPNVCDIFLRNTDFTLDECRRLCAFLKQEKETKGYNTFERVFYKHDAPSISDELLMTKLKKSPSMLCIVEDYDCDTPQLTEMEKMVKMLRESADWSFQDHGQIAFCNNIFKHYQTKYSFFESDAPGV
eukprot:120500_1